MYQVGQWVVVRPGGVGQITRISDEEPGAAGRRCFVVQWSHLGIILSELQDSTGSVQEIAAGAEGLIPVDRAEARMRPPMPADDARRLLSELNAPLDANDDDELQALPFPTFWDELRQALGGSTEQSVDLLRKVAASDRILAFAERRAIERLDAMTRGELELALAR